MMNDEFAKLRKALDDIEQRLDRDPWCSADSCDEFQPLDMTEPNVDLNGIREDLRNVAWRLTKLELEVRGVPDN